MLILLPNDPEGLDELALALDMPTVSDVIRRLDGLGDVHVQLPQFDIEAELDLQPILMQVGRLIAYGARRARQKGSAALLETLAPSLSLSAQTLSTFMFFFLSAIFDV